jgi:hypothetical protein
MFHFAVPLSHAVIAVAISKRRAFEVSRMNLQSPGVRKVEHAIFKK